MCGIIGISDGVRVFAYLEWIQEIKNMRHFWNPIVSSFILFNIFYSIIKRFPLICGYVHGWSNHVCIFVFLN